MHPNAGVGILLKTLAVVDADSREEVTRRETEWPVLHSVPMETTSKAAHYCFRRTTLCNELGLTDGPLNKQADFKSITGTGTAGTATDTLSKVWNIEYKFRKADLLYLRSVHQWHPRGKGVICNVLCAIHIRHIPHYITQGGCKC